MEKKNLSAAPGKNVEFMQIGKKNSYIDIYKAGMASYITQKKFQKCFIRKCGKKATTWTRRRWYDKRDVSSDICVEDVNYEKMIYWNDADRTQAEFSFDAPREGNDIEKEISRTWEPKAPP